MNIVQSDKNGGSGLWRSKTKPGLILLEIRILLSIPAAGYQSNDPRSQDIVVPLRRLRR